VKDDLLSKESINKGASSKVKSFCYTLGFISIFINSIGLNLTQINTALTEKIVEEINSSESPVIRKELEKAKAELKSIRLDIEELKKDSHKSN
jgi:hypothetical protein